MVYTVIQEREALRVCLEQEERAKDMEIIEKESLRSVLVAAKHTGKGWLRTARVNPQHHQ